MKENTKKIIKSLIISIIFSVILNVIFLKTNLYTNSLFLDRVFLIFCITEFLILHFCFGIKKLYEYIIKNRYIIAVIFLILTTLLSYNGSSMGTLSENILEQEKNNTLLFSERKANSQEYGVETLFSISQNSNNNNYMNSNLGLNETDMFTYTNAPVKDILIIGKLFNIGYLFLNSYMAIAFWWNFRLIALILATYELCMIITDKNKFYSIAGMIIIAFSSTLQWNFSTCLVDIIIFGEIMIILIDLFMKSNDKRLLKLGISIGFSVCLISYIFTFDIENMISFGYLFLAIAIWVIIKNKKEYKFKISDLVYIVIPIIISILLNYRYYIVSNGNTIFSSAIERVRTQSGLSLLFSYIYSVFLPFKEVQNAWYFASIMSVFPVPIIIAFYYLYKNDKHTEFLFPIAVIVTIELIHCFSGLPTVISNILLFKYVSVQSAALVIGFANVYLYLYILSNINEKIFNIKYAIRITLITVCFVAFISRPSELSSSGIVYAYACIYCLFAFLLLNSNDKKYKKVFFTFAIIFTIISGGFVNPITKGASIINKTELAEKIQELSKEECNWITVGDEKILANYAIANNARVINSTQVMENEDLFIKILGKEKAKETENLWKKYTNIEIKISDENDIKQKENSNNTIILEITKDKIKELNIRYIITYNDITELELDKKYEKVSENHIEINDEKYNKIAIYEVL